MDKGFAEVGRIFIKGDQLHPPPADVGHLVGNIRKLLLQADLEGPRALCQMRGADVELYVMRNGNIQ